MVNVLQSLVIYISLLGVSSAFWQMPLGDVAIKIVQFLTENKIVPKRTCAEKVFDESRRNRIFNAQLAGALHDFRMNDAVDLLLSKIDAICSVQETESVRRFLLSHSNGFNFLGALFNDISSDHRQYLRARTAEGRYQAVMAYFIRSLVDRALAELD